MPDLMNCRTVTVMSGDTPKPPAPWTVGIAEYRTRVTGLPHPAPTAFELVVWHETDLDPTKPLVILDMDDTIAECQRLFDRAEHDILEVLHNAGFESGREYLGKVPKDGETRYDDYKTSFLAYRNKHDRLLFDYMGYAPDRIEASVQAALEEFWDVQKLDRAITFGEFLRVQGINREADPEEQDTPLFELLRFDMIKAAKGLQDASFPWYQQSAAMLEQLSDQFNLVLVTRGDLPFQHHKLTQNANEVARYFTRVYVTPDKDRDVFAAVFADCGVEPGPQHVAIGNTYKTDVGPLVIDFECGGIWVDQDTEWVLETEAGHRGPTVPDHPAVRVARSLDELFGHATELSTIGATSAQQLNLGLDRLFGPNSQQAEQEPAMFRAPDLSL